MNLLFIFQLTNGFLYKLKNYLSRKNFIFYGMYVLPEFGEGLQEKGILLGGCLTVKY